MIEADVDPGNAEQMAAWDGEQGAFWADRAERIDAGVAGYRERFLAAAAAAQDAHVLDVGCGSGQVSRDLARSAGSVLGVDLSARLLGLARRLAAQEGLRNVGFAQADVQVHPFRPGSFDVAVSRHGAMFFADPVAAFANLARALRPGGRLVLLTWQPWQRNEWITAFRRALGAPAPSGPQSPGSLSDPDGIRALLAASGFTPVAVRDERAEMFFGDDVADAFEFVSAQFGWMLRDRDTEVRAAALAALRADLAAHCTEDGVYYRSAGWLVEARRA